SYCRISVDRSALDAFSKALSAKIPEVSRALDELSALRSRRFGIRSGEERFDLAVDEPNDLTKMVKRTGLLIRDAKTQPLLEYILPAVNWLAFVNNRPGLGTIADLNKRREESEARTGRDFRIPLRLRI